MKKKIMLLIGGLVISTSLIGCSNIERTGVDSNFQVQSQEIKSNRFQQTGEYYYINGSKFYEVQDTKNKNLYLYNEGDNSYGDIPQLTPLYDENGKIQKYK